MEKVSKLLKRFNFVFDNELNTYVNKNTKLPLTVYYEEAQNKLVLIDQNKLPYELATWSSSNWQEIAFEGIKGMIVRGSQAIGITGGYCLAVAAEECRGKKFDDALKFLQKVAVEIKSTRPTAVNLKWAVDRVLNSVKKKATNVDDVIRIAKEEANAILIEDLAINLELRKNGVKLIEDGDVIITHCNAGSLATSYGGSALGVLEEAFTSGKNITVIAKETRPRGQGLKLTMWELNRTEIPTIVITDNMISSSIVKFKITKAIVGADRISQDGCVANKIGTLDLAKICSIAKIPFYVAASYSTLDLTIKGNEIPIEERDWSEITQFYDAEFKIKKANGLLSEKACPIWHISEIISTEILPRKGKIRFYNPGFDVTPPRYINKIILDIGVYTPQQISNLTHEEVYEKVSKIVLKNEIT
ncbi:MAG: S-methyl-5-thioribose-1-phosphate isomerase [Candidatus Odinarchaeia archaeon]